MGKVGIQHCCIECNGHLVIDVATDVNSNAYVMAWLREPWTIRFEVQAPVVPRTDCIIHWINHYLLDKSINFDSTYSLDIDLSLGERFSTLSITEARF